MNEAGAVDGRTAAGETHVVLPFPPDEFRATSVAFAGPDWLRRFDEALAAAATASGATAAAPSLAAPAVATGPLDAAPGSAADRDEAPRSRYAMRSMLFDVAVAAPPADEQPDFASRFLRLVAASPGAPAVRPEHVEATTAGFAFVFEAAREALEFALDLAERVRAHDPTATGLSREFDVQLGLHCGPVHCDRNPVTRVPLYSGSHAGRSAAIAGLAPAGRTYATPEFAAVAAAQGVSDGAYVRVGPDTPAAAYEVRRRRA